MGRPKYMTAIELVNPTINPVVLNTQPDQALLNPDLWNGNYLPVINSENQFVGYVTLIGLQSMSDGSVVERENVIRGATLPTDCHYSEVVKLWDSLSMDVLAVTDSHGVYLGAINPQSLLQFWATSIGIKQPGSVIVLQVHSMDYMLSEIVRIVESNDVKILNIGVHEATDSEYLWLSLKLDTGILKGVLASLERYNYHLYAYFMRSDLQDDSDLKYQQLMKYLDL